MSGKATGWARDQRLRTATHKCVLMLLADHAAVHDGETEETCWPSHRALAEEASISVARVRTVLKELEGEGYITREDRYAFYRNGERHISKVEGRQTSNRYVLNLDRKEQDDVGGVPASDHPNEVCETAEGTHQQAGGYSPARRGGTHQRVGGVLTSEYPYMKPNIETQVKAERAQARASCAEARELFENRRQCEQGNLPDLMADIWNEVAKAGHLRRMVKLTGPRTKVARAALRRDHAGKLERWRAYVAALSSDISGHADPAPGWATFEWACREDTAVKASEGAYHNKPKAFGSGGQAVAGCTACGDKFTPTWEGQSLCQNCKPNRATNRQVAR